MSKIISKKNFIEKLSFYLSFYFDDYECVSILQDYEEWFDNEALQGKDEMQICSGLENPMKIARNLAVESGNNIGQKILFLRNTMLQTLCLVVMHFLISILVLKYCNRNGFDFFYIAICINFLIFFMGMFIVKRTVQSKVWNPRSNLLITGAFLMIILSEVLLLHRFNYSHIGKVYMIVLAILICIFVCLNIHIIMKKYIINKRLGFTTIFHVSGVITILFFLINQIHMFYGDITTYSYQVIIRSIYLYIQTAILYVILYKSKTFEKEQ